MSADGKKPSPLIYVYSINGDGKFKGLLKVGYTTRDAVTRIKEQMNIGMPDDISLYKIEHIQSALREDGSSFKDHDVHKILKKRNFDVGHEWFRCTVEDVQNAISSVKTNKEIEFSRFRNFEMRPEQKTAVEMTAKYFRNNSLSRTGRTPKFLWNAKMRFGKTFTSYKLADELNFRKVLVLTFKPSVVEAWEEDIKTHVDFADWDFHYAKNFNKDYLVNKDRKIVCFGSFQDILGIDGSGRIKEKNEIIHETNWDLVIFDEYHYGAWRDTAKGIFEDDEEKQINNNYQNLENDIEDTEINEKNIKITTNNYLFMSGTPFRSINNGEFIEDQVFNWSYTDEQKEKELCNCSPNPYAALPKMNMYVYQLPKDIDEITGDGEFNEFNLNKFFEAKKVGNKYVFQRENKVQQWLNYIRAAHNPSSIDEMRMVSKKPIMPYSDTNLLKNLNHTVWFLPSVASCNAMADLLKSKNNKFYEDYKVIVAAGDKAGIGAEALMPIRKAMGNDPINSKSITLTCGKLLTGSTIMPWTGIFMLCNLTSPETYFQAAFRVQTPWVIDSEDGKENIIIKKDCYVFDFAINRALSMVSEYSRKTGRNRDPEQNVREFTSYLPIIAYDGSTLKELNSADVLEYASSGTTATLLAKRFESTLLVNVDNETLSRILDNEEALYAISKISDFRNMKIRDQFKIIINDSEKVKDAKATGKDKVRIDDYDVTITEADKELKKRRKEILEKLKKFATKIPIFMYLTDHREKSIIDIIESEEAELFTDVTGITVKDFGLLKSLNLFNGPVLEDAIFKFKRYEDASLEYTGIRVDKNRMIGGWDTTIGVEDFNKLY